MCSLLSSNHPHSWVLPHSVISLQLLIWCYIINFTSVHCYETIFYSLKWLNFLLTKTLLKPWQLKKKNPFLEKRYIQKSFCLLHKLAGVLSAHFGSGHHPLYLSWCSGILSDTSGNVLALGFAGCCLDFRFTLLRKTCKALSRRKRSCLCLEFHWTQLLAWAQSGLSVWIANFPITVKNKLKQVVLGFMLVFDW